MKLQIIPEQQLTAEELKTYTIPEDITVEDWEDGHRKLLYYKEASRYLILKSQAFGAKKFGIETVARVQAMFCLQMGIDPTKPAMLERDPETDVLRHLQQSVERWMAKSNPEAWDKDKLTRALDLLEPMEREAKRVRELLEATR
jgi:hypothetical protein